MTADLDLGRLRRWADNDDERVRQSTWPYVPELLDRIEQAESLLRLLYKMGTVYDADIGKPEWTPHNGYVRLTPEQHNYLKELG